MFIDVCPGCGMYMTKKRIEGDGESAVCICEDCGHRHAFLRLPLFVVLGPSGAGKTTLCMQMGRLSPGFVFLDGDTLLPAATGDWDAFRRMWLALCVNIHQSGRPVCLFMGGMPQDFLQNEMHPFFSKIVPIGLYASAGEIKARLGQRPAWRKSATADFVADMLKYNQMVQALPGAINTANRSILEVAQELLGRIKKESA